MLRRYLERIRFVTHRAREFRDDVWRFHRQTRSLGRTKIYAQQLMKLRSRHIRDLIQSRAEAQQQAPHIAAEIARDPRLLVAILVSGGIGDYIVVARFLRDLAAEVEEFRFDIYCSSPAVAQWTFSPLPGFNKIYGHSAFGRLQARYPLALRVHHLIELWLRDADWGVLSKHERLVRACLRITRQQGDFAPLISRHPHLDNELANMAVSRGYRRETLLQGMAGVKYGGAAFPLPFAPEAVARHRLPERYVTINNAVDTNFIITGSAPTKSYPHWDALVEALKQRYPDISVVQIGSNGSSPIHGIDVSVVGKTTLPEAAAIVGGALLHIDHEGGLVHIAASLGTISVVIFGPTSFDYFAYPQNINMRPPVCGNCWWIEANWMDICARGEERPPCMYQQSPEAVLEALGQRWSDESCTTALSYERKVG